MIGLVIRLLDELLPYLKYPKNYYLARGCLDFLIEICEGPQQIQQAIIEEGFLKIAEKIYKTKMNCLYGQFNEFMANKLKFLTSNVILGLIRASSNETELFPVVKRIVSPKMFAESFKHYYYSFYLDHKLKYRQNLFFTVTMMLDICF